MSDKSEKAMQVFKKHYAPAANFADSDEQMTTRAIFDRFRDLTYDKSLKIDKFYDLMEQNGFQFIYFLDEFTWLLKINDSSCKAPG
jgi:hypothetical protein